jgi:hypothetical protein
MREFGGRKMCLFFFLKLQNQQKNLKIQKKWTKNVNFNFNLQNEAPFCNKCTAGPYFYGSAFAFKGGCLPLMNCAEKGFCFMLPRGKWMVEFTDDESILGNENFAFGIGYVYLRKGLTLKKRNALLLEQLAKAVVFDTSRFEYMRALLDDNFMRFTSELALNLKSILLNGNITRALKQQARKERYLKNRKIVKVNFNIELTEKQKEWVSRFKFFDDSIREAA